MRKWPWIGSVHVIDQRATIEIPPGHPALPGHFPGRPIVPGVLLLARVIGAYRERHPGLHIDAVPRAKFLSPLLPAERCDVGFRDAPGGGVDFECAVGARLVACGTLVFAVP